MKNFKVINIWNNITVSNYNSFFLIGTYILENELFQNTIKASLSDVKYKRYLIFITMYRPLIIIQEIIHLLFLSFYIKLHKS